MSASSRARAGKPSIEKSASPAQQRVKRAESRRFGASGSVRENAAAIAPPLTLPENVPAPREKVAFIVICEPVNVPLPEPENVAPSFVLPLMDALTFDPF